MAIKRRRGEEGEWRERRPEEYAVEIDGRKVYGKKRKLVFGFLESWNGDKTLRDTVLKSIPCSLKEFRRYKLEFENKDKMTQFQKELERIGERVKERSRGHRKLTEENKIENVVDTLYEIAVNQKNWNACKAFLQLKGIFTEEKSDGSVKVDADRYFAIREEAHRLIGDRGLSGRDIFLEEVREDTGAEQGDNPVAAVEAPDSVS